MRARQLRIPLLGPLLVLALLASVPVPPVPGSAPTAYGAWCTLADGIPVEAYAVEEFARAHNYSPPRGYKGNSAFLDRRRLLPPVWRPYKEYDVYPQVPGARRRPERVVLSDRYEGASWYTPNHYDNFILMFPSGCRDRHEGAKPQPTPRKKPLPMPPQNKPSPMPAPAG